VRRAISAAEMIIAALILGAALVPMYQMFVKGTTTATQSRLAYMALHVAREELEEIRQIPFDKLPLVAHPFQRVSGHLFRRTLNTPTNPRGAPGSNPIGQNNQLTYPKEYERIFTQLRIEETSPQDPRMKKAILDVKWEETGAGSERKREAISHFETIVAAHNAERP
jgi:hypothetical protein